MSATQHSLAYRTPEGPRIAYSPVTYHPVGTRRTQVLEGETMSEPTVTLHVTRYHPEHDSALRQQSYSVPYHEDWVVLDALNYIKDQIDGLTFRWSCRMGVCGSCGMMVNGVPRLTCAAFLGVLHPHEIRVEPLNNFPIIRDLVIDDG